MAANCYRALLVCKSFATVASMKAIKLTTWLTISTLCVLLSACAPPNAQITAQQQAPKPILSDQAKQYLQQAQSSASPQANDFNLQALNSMIQSGDFNGAEQQITQLKAQNLNAQQAAHFQLLQAYFLLATGKPYESIVALGKIKNKNTFDAALKAQYQHILASAYARNNQLDKSIVLQLMQRQYQTKPTYLDLWYQLQNQPLAALNQLAVRYHNNTFLNGWLRLAIIAKENSNHWQHLSDSLIAWRQQFPQHPGNQFLPSQNSLPTLQLSQTPSQIAVLLPTSGPLKSIAKAVEDGIIHAYFDTPSKKRIALRFYDTSQGDVSDVYKQAISNGAQVVIGPLTKQNAATIANDTKVPTITLNYSDASSNQLVEFGLSPSQEAQQAAEHAWQYGVNRILTITPNSAWGNTVLTAFSQSWQYPNALIVDSLAFKPDNIKLQIATLLGVAQSYQRAAVVKAAVKFAKNQYTRFTPRRRQDMNGIFLASTAAEAKTILPLLKFYFTGMLPIFSTSSIYTVDSSARYNLDFNGTYFCDMPFIIGQSPDMITLRHTIKRTWPRVYRHHANLIALGIDSYQLAQSYQRLQALPYFGIQGVTGRLYLKPNHQIYRQLIWAKFKNGKPVIIS